MLGQRKKASERGLLTSCRVQRGGQVRTTNENERKKGTDFLAGAGRETSEGSEIRRTSEGHSPTEEHQWIENSGHRKKVDGKGHSHTGGRRARHRSRCVKKARGRGTLTSWRVQIQDMCGHRKEASE
jgi:hypothetical protein